MSSPGNGPRSGASTRHLRGPEPGESPPSAPAEGECAWEVPADWHRQRADLFVCSRLADWSRSRVQRLFSEGLVSCGDDPIPKNEKLCQGDTVRCTLPAPQPSSLVAAPIPLSILYEDEHLLAVDKAAGMVTHPGAGTGGDTLVHALLYHCRGSLSGIGGVERPGIVHRLDRETSGVLVVAKTDLSHAALANQFCQRTLEKEYLAVVWGIPRLESGSIQAAIGRHPVNRMRMAVRADGREARTDWVKVGQGSGRSLLRIRLHTGRTHQIRVHLAHLGHPVVGDPVYGNPRLEAGPWHPPRMLLHSWRLSLQHPATGQVLNLEAPVPPEFPQAVSAGHA